MYISKFSNTPFLTYQKQIEFLIANNVIIDDESFALRILRSVPVYTLYDEFSLSLASSGIFRNGIRLESLFDLYVLSNELSSVLLKNILIAERSFKARFSYMISEKYGISTDIDDTKCINTHDYLFRGHYSNPRHMRTNILKKIKEEVLAHPNEDLRQCLSHKVPIPPWVLIDNIPLGLTINWYTLLKPEDKSEIIRDYWHNTTFSESTLKELFKISLKILKYYRNAFAHGSKVIGVKGASELSLQHARILSSDNLPENYGSSDHKNGLFPLILVLNNMLEKEFSITMIRELESLFERFSKEKRVFSKRELFKLYSLPDDATSYLKCYW